MSSDFTASTTAKDGTATSNPFNQIVEIETEQAARLQAEKEKMQQETVKAKEQAALKLTESEARLKKAAMAELGEFKNAEPATILKEAKKKADTIQKNYTDKFKARSPEVAKSVVQSYLESL